MQKTLCFKINVAILVTAAVIALFMGILISLFEADRRGVRYEDVRVLLETLFQQKRNDLANEIFAGQDLALSGSLADMRQVKGVAAVTAYDLDGKLVLSTDESVKKRLSDEIRADIEQAPVFVKTNVNERPHVEYLALIQAIGQEIGYIKIRYDLAELEREFLTTRGFFVGLFFCMLITMLLLLNIFLNRSVIRPASLLREAIRKVQKGRLGEQADVPAGDEIGQIAADFNAMSLRLKDQHIALSNAIQDKDAYAARLEDLNLDLERLNTRLEEMVEARTADLHESNAQLRQEINERKRAEEERGKLHAQLLQAQKMESLGTLAGGVAHDFNNLLHAISGNVQLLMMNKQEGHPDFDRLKIVAKSIERAAHLIRQLLLFSRKAESRRQRVDLNQEVRDTLIIMERTIPKMVAIKLRLEGRLWPILADPVQIEQILLNLAGNALDSMPEGGRLTIETGNMVLDEAFTKVHSGARPGRHVFLTVTDTGCGMDQNVLEHIFDPFFTTKEVGKGTGLGMASAYGIVKGHGGYIQCYSELGLGSTFRVYLPALEPEDVATAVSQPETPPQGGSETILVVDDEEAIRELTREVLESLGYVVKSASSGEEALETYQAEGKSIDLVLLDLNMPGIGGHKSLQELLRLDPSVKVVIASGYTANGRGKDALSSGAMGFLGKPYQLKELAAMVRSVLDE